MWRPDDPQGNEAEKIKWRLLEWTRGRGLDIGCGMWKPFNHFIGVDTVPAPGVNLTSHCLYLDFLASGEYDFVFSSHLLEHLEDTQGALKHWWRLLHPGGFLILYLPHKDYYPNIGQPGANPDHKHDFTPDDVINAATEALPDWDLRVRENRNDGNEYSFFLVFEKLAAGEGHRASYLKPKPEKTACVVRYGAYGDALMGASILPKLKAEGYHVTVYTQEAGEEILKHDPHIDRLVVHSAYQIETKECLLLWAYESHRFDRWINLTGSVESLLLPQPGDIQFYYPDYLRAQMMNVNYLESIHRFADVPAPYRQKFYPSEEELAWAQEERAKYDGPVVVLNPAGSTFPKFWPYTERFVELMAADGVHTVVLGDMRGTTPKMAEKYGHMVGKDWSIRKACTFALLADAVVGEESVLVNAVAMEENLKVVLLSHSSAENLTKHWVNTVAMAPKGLECYPCHRVHPLWHYCNLNREVKAAVCQASEPAELVAGVVWQYLTGIEEAVGSAAANG